LAAFSAAPLTAGDHPATYGVDIPLLPPFLRFLGAGFLIAFFLFLGLGRLGGSAPNCHNIASTAAPTAIIASFFKADSKNSAVVAITSFLVC
jgi:amino acid transporter